MLSGELGTTGWPILLAGAAMTTVPVALLFLVAQRPFARATEMGGLLAM
jgi:ABC-type glycerol-3-phosphate transport system permease component